MTLDGSLTGVRSQILRQYYERTLGGSSPVGQFDGATFDEYFALARIRSPGVTPWTAARNSPSAQVPHFQEELQRLGPEPAAPAATGGFHSWIERKAVGEVTSDELAAGSTQVTFQSVKDIRGWQHLRRFDKLEELWLRAAGTTDETWCSPPIEISRLELHGCTLAAVTNALRSTRAVRVTIMEASGRVFDAARLGAQERLRDLEIFHGLIRNVRALESLLLQRLSLCHAHVDEDVSSVLIALKGTLAELALVGSEPFGPQAIPLGELKKLTRLSVSVSPEHRDAWLETACANPRIHFHMSYAADEAPKQKITVAEIYRDIDILSIQKGTKTTFEVSGDMTEYAEGRGFEGSNGDLEDELAARAKAAKVRGLKWSSENDTLVAQAANIEGLRWVIDAIREG